MASYVWVRVYPSIGQESLIVSSTISAQEMTMSTPGVSIPGAFLRAERIKKKLFPNIIWVCEKR